MLQSQSFCSRTHRDWEFPWQDSYSWRCRANPVAAPDRPHARGEQYHPSKLCKECCLDRPSSAPSQLDCVGGEKLLSTCWQRIFAFWLVLVEVAAEVILIKDCRKILVSSKIIKLSINIYLIYIFFTFQYFWTKTFGNSYTSIRQIFSTWQWFPSIWCYYIWICKNVQYLNEKPVKVEERSKFTIVNMFSMHINNFFFYFIYFSNSLRTVYFLDCLYLGLLGVGTSLFPPANLPIV